jgi:anhydro-N-acetylmuramic acid kinase
MARRYRALGLMSGTSMDGIDAAVIETDGRVVLAKGPTLSVPYEAPLKGRIQAVLGARGEVEAVAREITIEHANSIKKLDKEYSVNIEKIDVIGFHGQTILHEPENRRTVQIGDGALLSQLTGVDVVASFREADVADGGQGAPFAPLYHAALAHDLPRPLAVLNIGGVANVTWIGHHGELLGFDTGPGNALLDDWVRRHGAGDFDRDGKLAASGRVDEATLAGLLDNPYFRRPAPKSLDRDAFAGALDAVAQLSLADGAATLAAFTVESVGLGAALLPEPAHRWLVCGGGRHNPQLMAGLSARLQADVAPVEAVGWRGDFLEAEAFAFLAVRSLLGLPLSLPETTGVSRPMPGGRLFRAAG